MNSYRAVMALLSFVLLAGCAEQADVGAASSALSSSGNVVWRVAERASVAGDLGNVRLIYHPDLERLLMVSSRPNRGVWKREGAGWDFVASAAEPTMYQGAVAYDPVRNVVVMMGGRDEDSTSADFSNKTWLFDGAEWTEGPAVGPSRRAGSAMAFHPGLGEVMLFGGDLGNRRAADTWTFDGTRWMRLDAAVMDELSVQHMGFDQDANRMILTGHVVFGGPISTWEWDGTGWALLPATHGARRNGPLAWNAATSRLTSLTQEGLYEFVDSDWVFVPGSDRPTISELLVYNESNEQLTAFGGDDMLWEWDGSTWSATLDARPSAGGVSRIAYDTDRNSLTMLSAIGNVVVRSWEWSGDGWAQGLENRGESIGVGAFEYDSARARFVALIGEGIWHFDGATWSQPAADPVSGRLMVFDEAREVMVIHPPAAGDTHLTFTWDGMTLTEVLGPQPTSVRDSLIAYDASREVVVRFGGYTDGSGTSAIDETWEFDGSTWTQASPAVSPSARGGGFMTYDREREVVVLFGGYNHGEVWTYDGMTWTLCTTLGVTGPRRSFGSGMVYDTGRGRSVFMDDENTLWDLIPVGDSCGANTDCTSGFCADGVCCDRGCSSSCTACSIAAGSSREGICELLPDSGTECEDALADAGPDAIGPTTEPDGGCGCTVAGQPRSEGRTLFVLEAMLLFAFWRMRKLG